MDPVRDANLEGKDAERVIGGEVTMWTERVDAETLDYWIWPRTGAAGEALWSPATNADPAHNGEAPADHAAWRLERARCRMVARGTRASPLYPGRNCRIPKTEQ
jgi:hexosaminidase